MRVIPGTAAMADSEPGGTYASTPRESRFAIRPPSETMRASAALRSAGTMLMETATSGPPGLAWIWRPIMALAPAAVFARAAVCPAPPRRAPRHGIARPPPRATAHLAARATRPRLEPGASGCRRDLRPAYRDPGRTRAYRRGGPLSVPRPRAPHRQPTGPLPIPARPPAPARPTRTTGDGRPRPSPGGAASGDRTVPAEEDSPRGERSPRRGGWMPCTAGRWCRRWESMADSSVQTVVAINRVRRHYLEVAPELRPHFTLTDYDDPQGC